MLAATKKSLTHEQITEAKVVVSGATIKKRRHASRDFLSFSLPHRLLDIPEEMYPAVYHHVLYVEASRPPIRVNLLQISPKSCMK
jgi:hypothetical protein